SSTEAAASGSSPVAPSAGSAPGLRFQPSGRCSRTRIGRSGCQRRKPWGRSAPDRQRTPSSSCRSTPTCACAGPPSKHCISCTRRHSVALKDRLEARRRADGGQPPPGDVGLSVIDGLREEPAQVAPPPPDEASPPKPGRPSATHATAKAAIHAQLVEQHAHEIDITDRESVRSRIASVAEDYMKTTGLALNRLDYGHLIDALLDEVLGLGPLQALLEDPATSEIMVNHPAQIFVERGGRVSLSPVVFESEAQLRQVIDRIVSTVGRRVDESSPMCDARLRDGSRVNVG